MRIIVSTFFIIIFSYKSLLAEPWHRYQLDKLVNEQCQPKTAARIRFLNNERKFWSAVKVAAEAQLESIATEGGVSGYCVGRSGSKLYRCQAYIKSYILLSKNCKVLAQQQLRLLKN